VVLVVVMMQEITFPELNAIYSYGMKFTMMMQSDAKHK
jgi:hypothetical protein